MEEDEIIENIKRECLCGYCHGSITKNVGLGCACTEECRALDYLRVYVRDAEGATEDGMSTIRQMLYRGVQKWFHCANLAKEMRLSQKAIQYQKEGVWVCEKFNDFDSAKKYSENFGFTELVEYYQKLIDLKTSRPK